MWRLREGRGGGGRRTHGLIAAVAFVFLRPAGEPLPAESPCLAASVFFFDCMSDSRPRPVHAGRQPSQLNCNAVSCIRHRARRSTARAVQSWSTVGQEEGAQHM